jgi:hypothetical protein
MRQSAGGVALSKLHGGGFDLDLLLLLLLLMMMMMRIEKIHLRTYLDVV